MLWLLARVMRWFRLRWYRYMPVAWLKRERVELFNDKAVLSDQPWSSHRDNQIAHLNECLEDSRAELESRGHW